MKPIVKYKGIVIIIATLLAVANIHWYHLQGSGLFKVLPILFVWYYFINKWSKPIYKFWYNNYSKFTESEIQ